VADSDEPLSRLSRRPGAKGGLSLDTPEHIRTGTKFRQAVVAGRPRRAPSTSASSCRWITRSSCPPRVRVSRRHRSILCDVLESLSPDRKWFLGVRDHNLWLRPVSGVAGVPLTTDGTDGHEWVEKHLRRGSKWAWWSPDSSKVCGVDSVVITEFDCFKFTKKGKKVDRTDDCVVTIAGDTITIAESAGVGTHNTWLVSAADSSSNSIAMLCEVEVAKP
jgi:hypothetical protein